MSSAISVLGVSKFFGDVRAVDGVTLDIAEGEFLTLLGPSGSGKTTLLRLIAGFDRPTTGSITLGGADVTDLPPNRRPVNTVFQDYALFPHMNVRENIEYGLKVKKVSSKERSRRSSEVLARTQLEQFAERMPDQLSGGQRQRVSFARAIINEPKVLLLDEPLGALDLKLRERLQWELHLMHRELGITLVYVTHDQGEALSLSDRVAVFRQGRVEQIGTPHEIYDHPANTFVASFVGMANIFDEVMSEQLFGMRATHMLRPERISLAPADSDTGRVAEITDIQFLGAETRLWCRLADGTGVVMEGASVELATARAGQTVRLVWNPDALVPIKVN